MFYSSVAGDDIIPPVQSARIISRDSFAFNYGTIEIRAKMPKGDWLWPGKITINSYSNLL